MIQFAELFQDERILVSLVQELTWTHFIALLPLKDPLAREFYAEMCQVERRPNKRTVTIYREWSGLRR